MRLLALLLLAATSPETGREPSPIDVNAPGVAPVARDAEEIMRVLLAVQGRTEREWGSRQFCVKAKMADPTFAALRRALNEQKAHRTRPGSPGSESRLGDFYWTEPNWSRQNYLRMGGKLAREEERQVRQAIRAITSGAEPRPLIGAIDAGVLPAPLKLCEGKPQQPYLEIYGPTIEGDIAFVETAYLCPLCGQGLIYALKRNRSTWKIVALAETWVS